MRIKKKLRSIFCICMAMVMIILPGQSVYATETHKDVVVSEVYANAQKNMKDYYGESEKITVLATEYRTTTVTPTGQNPGGTSFPTGGGFYVNSNGGVDVSVSFTLAWEFVSASINVGYASTGNVVGAYVSAPANNNFYMVKIDKTLKFEQHKVDVYRYNVYQYTYYTTVHSLYSETMYVVKVN